MESGERGGAGMGTGTGVRLLSRLGLGARETEGTVRGVVTVGKGRVGAWGAVSQVLLLERPLWGRIRQRVINGVNKSLLR